MEDNNNEVEEHNNVKDQIIERKNDGQTNLDKPKKDKTSVIILILLSLMAICALVYLFILKPAYEKDKQSNGNNTNEQTKENNGNQNVSVISENDALEIAIQKLDAANNFLDDSTRSSSEEYGNEGEAQQFIYYNTVDNFKKEFYNIYSSQLSYKDVLLEFNLDTSDNPNYETNVSNVNLIHDVVRGYAIKDSKVYTNSCNLVGGLFGKNGNYAVESVTSDTIKVNYEVLDFESEENDTLHESGSGQIVLVKENNDWKILKATIVNMCNGVYEVGK